MKFPPSGVFLERDYSAGKILGAVETNLIEPSEQSQSHGSVLKVERF